MEPLLDRVAETARQRTLTKRMTTAFFIWRMHAQRSQLLRVLFERFHGTKRFESVLEWRFESSTIF
jgi:hypothetical protein